MTSTYLFRVKKNYLLACQSKKVKGVKMRKEIEKYGEFFEIASVDFRVKTTNDNEIICTITNHPQYLATVKMVHNLANISRERVYKQDSGGYSLFFDTPEEMFKVIQSDY